jgi:hypothetical protein
MPAGGETRHCRRPCESRDPYAVSLVLQDIVRRLLRNR